MYRSDITLTVNLKGTFTDQLSLEGVEHFANGSDQEE